MFQFSNVLLKCFPRGVLLLIQFSSWAYDYSTTIITRWNSGFETNLISHTSLQLLL